MEQIFPKFFSRERALLWLSMGIIFLYFLPYFIFGKSAPLQVLDNLDCYLFYIDVLLDHGLLYPPPQTQIDQIFNGIPSSILYHTYDLGLLPFKFFGLYWGYIFNKILMSLVGFWGMYFLLKRHFIKEDKLSLLAIGPALIFALLPHWSYLAHASGMPAVLYAFLNIRKGNIGWINWALIAFYAFYSSLILAGLFLMIFLGIIFLYDAFSKKKISLPYFLALGFFALAYVISHYPLMHSFFSSEGIVSHRAEFHTDPHGWKYGITKSLYLFGLGQYLSHSLHTLLLLPILGIFYLEELEKK